MRSVRFWPVENATDPMISVKVSMDSSREDSDQANRTDWGI
jgi:hypothetical protein